MPYECLDCDRTFATTVAIQSHARANWHSYSECERCDRIFVNENALNNHLDTSFIHKFCDLCQRSFKSRAGYEQHVASSPAHYQSDESEDDDSEPVDSWGSEEETYCSSCNRSFASNGALFDHLIYNSRHNWCFICSRDFNSPNALAQHNASPVHRGRSFECPFCEGMFKTPSAIAMHIESGCHHVNRHQVTAAVHCLNIVPQISISRRIEGSMNPPTKLITYSANERAWNGHAYECYLCHAPFKALDRLNQHLNSPTHDQLEFKCPHCKAEFQLISGLTQHIESEVCGIARFGQVATQFEQLTSSFSRLLTF